MEASKIPYTDFRMSYTFWMDLSHLMRSWI